jgi:hypothetical protein
MLYAGIFLLVAAVPLWAFPRAIRSEPRITRWVEECVIGLGVSGIALILVGIFEILGA